MSVSFICQPSKFIRTAVQDSPLFRYKSQLHPGDCVLKMSNLCEGLTKEYGLERLNKWHYHDIFHSRFCDCWNKIQTRKMR